MNTSSEQTLSNGSAAAAILSAGIGACILGLFTFLGDVAATFKNLFNFYSPTGPLSGVTASAVIIWLIIWAFFYFRWKDSDRDLSQIFTIALVLIGLGLILIFPPFIDIFG